MPFTSHTQNLPAIFLVREATVLCQSKHAKATGERSLVFVSRCASKPNSKSTGDTSNMVTYVNLKKTGMAWALHDSKEVRLGYCVCVVA
jgi:hypothetical protein